MSKISLKLEPKMTVTASLGPVPKARKRLKQSLGEDADEKPKAAASETPS